MWVFPHTILVRNSGTSVWVGASPVVGSKRRRRSSKKHWVWFWMTRANYSRIIISKRKTRCGSVRTWSTTIPTKQVIRGSTRPYLSSENSCRRRSGRCTDGQETKKNKKKLLDFDLDMAPLLLEKVWSSVLNKKKNFFLILRTRWKAFVSSVGEF